MTWMGLATWTELLTWLGMCGGFAAAGLGLHRLIEWAEKREYDAHFFD